jgi:hypothetical protein
MKISILNRIRAYKEIMWDMLLSAAGCFVLRGCFRLVAEGRDSRETKAIACSIGQARDRLAHVGAALILLALATNEEPGLVRASSENHS